MGIVAVEGGRWEIYIDGAAGANVRKGDLLATVDSQDEAITLTGRFMQYCRENAKWLERSHDFVPRIGLTELQAIVVEDRDGIASGLDEAMQRPVDAYRDPWQEHRQPGSATRCRWSSCPRCRPGPPTYSFPRRRNDDKRVGDWRRAAQTWPGGSDPPR